MNAQPVKATSKCGRFRSINAAAIRRHEISCHKCALIYAGRAWA